MKKNFLIIATLAVLASTASAASTRTDSEVVVLPTYVVTAPRYQPVEQQINARLKELRETARQDSNILPAPSLPVLQPAKQDQAAKVSAAKIVAKS